MNRYNIYYAYYEDKSHEWDDTAGTPLRIQPQLPAGLSKGRRGASFTACP